jgi:hypothetical protein
MPNGWTLHSTHLPAWDTTYPLMINPLIYVEQKVIASDGEANDNFGWSAALDGDTALVGVYNDVIGANQSQGSAYVFTRSGTTWSQQQKLTASDGEADDNFGWSVALSGDTALVGAKGDNTNQGSVYVFTRVGTT